MTRSTDVAAPVLSAALAYCDHLPGRLHPLRADEKRPKLASWQVVASRDPDQIQSWFEHSTNNVGFVPDRCCFVVDLDCKKDKDGFASMAALEREFGPLPTTLAASTPNGGAASILQRPGPAI